MRLSDIVREVEQHGRLPLAVAVRGELLAEAWEACEWPPTMRRLLAAIGHPEHWYAERAVTDMAARQFPNPAYAAQCIRWRVPTLPTVEQIAAALAARAGAGG